MVRLIYKSTMSKKFVKRLLGWWPENKRTYVWRNTRDPYRIAIAEMMLQRTRANQVEPIYKRFMEKYPTPETLAKAPAKEVAEDLRSLGLLHRAKKVQNFAIALVNKYNGVMPQSRDELLKLPRIGDYVADAVLSSAYGQDVAAVDVNVVRILQRVFGLKGGAEARRNIEIRKLAQMLVPRGNAREYNLAMIDFAALICVPRAPKCGECPLATICVTRPRIAHTVATSAQ